jgi:hypothetical protein
MDALRGLKMFTKNSRNQYDKRDSLELGQNAEDGFTKLALNQGWEICPSSSQSNINEHYDYIIKKDEKVFKVEVKSLKRLSRKDAHTQDEYLWIELHGVRENDRGWLYDGKADLFAFEMIDRFRIVKRTDLISLIEKLVDFNAMTASSKDALYKLYQRAGRYDLLTTIKANDLMQITNKDWGK